MNISWRINVVNECCDRAVSVPPDIQTDSQAGGLRMLMLYICVWIACWEYKRPYPLSTSTTQCVVGLLLWWHPVTHEQHTYCATRIVIEVCPYCFKLRSADDICASTFQFVRRKPASAPNNGTICPMFHPTLNISCRQLKTTRRCTGFAASFV